MPATPPLSDDDASAPMPGTIATVPVHIGQKLGKGEALVILEAMKMETIVRAERDGVIKERLARPGAQVDTKDLLLVFE
jgi:pyruvate carboxylase